MQQKEKTTTCLILESQPVDEYRYHKHWLPVPDGWELASDLLDTHHGRHAIIIRRKK